MWEVDFKGWKRKDMKAFNKAMESGEEDALLPFYAKAIKKWPMALDPQDTNSYDELDLEDWLEVRVRFEDALKSVVARSESGRAGEQPGN